MIFTDIRLMYKMNGDQVEHAIIVKCDNPPGQEWFMFWGNPMPLYGDYEKIKLDYHLAEMPSQAIIAKIAEIQDDIADKQRQIERLQRQAKGVPNDEQS